MIPKFVTETALAAFVSFLVAYYALHSSFVTGSGLSANVNLAFLFAAMTGFAVSYPLGTFLGNKHSAWSGSLLGVGILFIVERAG